MFNLKNNELDTILGGSCPYCDGRDAGQRFRSWLGGVWDRMVEGAMITQQAMQSGK